MDKQKKTAPAVQETTADLENKDLSLITQFILTRINAEKIICFGSIVNKVRNTSCFLREESQVTSKENSYCLLIIPAENEKIADIALQQRLEEDIKTIASVTILVHRMPEVNVALQNGSSFFSTIYKKGKLLHDSEKEPFIVPAKGTDIGKRITKREKFWDQWHLLSHNFFKGAGFYQEQQFNNLAIFMLHQSLQHCYSGMLRVLTGYRSNSNSLRRLLRLVDNILPEFSFSSLKQTPENARLSGLLMKGFSDARYNDKFDVSTAELQILMGRVDKIIKQANITCLEHLNNLRTGKKAYTV